MEDVESGTGASMQQHTTGSATGNMHEEGVVSVSQMNVSSSEVSEIALGTAIDGVPSSSAASGLPIESSSNNTDTTQSSTTSSASSDNKATTIASDHSNAMSPTSPALMTRSKSTSDAPSVVEKPQSPLRWLMLVIFCLTMITNYYCYDIPAALKTQVYTYLHICMCTYAHLLYIRVLI